MNELEQALVDYHYENEDINKRIIIFKRTKNKRIKNKQFVKILSAATKERKVIKCSDVVLLDIDYYLELKHYEVLYEKLKKQKEE